MLTEREGERLKERNINVKIIDWLPSTWVLTVDQIRNQAHNLSENQPITPRCTG